MKKSPLHAIVVNTHDEIASGIVRAIQNEKLHVTVYSCALDVLDLIQNKPAPDIIIADLHLPGIDAWHFCRLLRSPEFKTTNDTPILITSSMFIDTDLVRMAKGLGVNACISLPCNDSLLHSTVTNLIATP